jgi:hypothetical protein
MIICWEDNARRDKDRMKSQYVKKLPPIFELKSFLEKGKITLQENKPDKEDELSKVKGQ